MRPKKSGVNIHLTLCTIITKTMKINNVKITILPGKLSECEADAYVLPYYSYHVNPDYERREVELAGARGVRLFIEKRLRHQIERRPLSLGDVFITDSLGGKSRKLVNIICRDEDEELAKLAIYRGMLYMFCHSEEHGLKKVAMVPLCVSDGLKIKEFTEIFKKFMERCPEPHSIEEIVVLCKDEAQANELKALCQE